MTETAQGVYETEMSAREARMRAHLIDRLMIYWRECAEEYRILPFKYLFLLEEKRKAKVKLKRLMGKPLDEYPEIPFFRITASQEARAWCESKRTGELEYELYRLEFTLGGDHSYRSLKAWISDTNYTLYHAKPSKFSLAM